LLFATVPVFGGEDAAPAPGKQVLQTIELPASTSFCHPEDWSKFFALPVMERWALLPKLLGTPRPLDETKKETMSYWLFLPSDYPMGGQTSTKKFPLMLFLHGAGDRSADPEKVKANGPPKLLEDPATAADWQFITVSPRCPENHYWSPTQLLLLLDDIEKKYAIDKSRIYVTGLSMGAFGTWMLLDVAAERFAAAAPVCGGYDPAKAERFTDVPIWIFHGDRDHIVPVTFCTIMQEAIEKAGGKKVKSTIYPGVDHDSWTETYNNPELYKWLLEHTR